MRRNHNVIAATLFILGIIYLCAQREGSLVGYDILHTVNQDKDRGQGHAPAKSKIELDQGERVVSTALPVHTGKAAHNSQSLPPGGLQDPPLPATTPESQSELSEQLPSAGLPDIPPSVQEAPVQAQPEFLFQKDLDLEVPDSILKGFSKHPPLHYGKDIPKTYAYATFMSTHNPSLKDPYFLAILSLTHRVLWSSRSQTKDYPFIVFVAHYVTQEQRDVLAGTGAVVRELAPVEWHCNKENVQKRWTDLFAKLNMWAETEFQRIVFLDADAFPLTNIDDMFDQAPVQNCVEQNAQLDDFLPDRTPVCEPYIFAGVPQDADESHPFYPNINVGSMIFTPSKRMHQRLMQNYLKYDHYDCAMAEQAFLNWQFHPHGAFPSTFLDRKWGWFFPQEDEQGRMKVVHEKIWAFGEGWTKREWNRGWEELVAYYKGEEFDMARKLSGLAGIAA